MMHTFLKKGEGGGRGFEKMQLVVQKIKIYGKTYLHNYLRRRSQALLRRSHMQDIVRHVPIALALISAPAAGQQQEQIAWLLF